MTTQLAVVPSNADSAFLLEQRKAKMFATSPLVPSHLRQGGETQAVANCYIAMQLADIMGEAPLVVMQNIHVVNGKAGFDTKYMIARANQAGVFSQRINWTVDNSDPKNLRVTAFALLKETNERVEFTCDMAMARAEKWDKNAKYQSMPELMLRYRSAAFLIRLHCPEVMLGYHTADELETLPPEQAPIHIEALTVAALAAHAADGEAIDAETETETTDTQPEIPDNSQRGDEFDGDSNEPDSFAPGALYDVE